MKIELKRETGKDNVTAYFVYVNGERMSSTMEFTEEQALKTYEQIKEKIKELDSKVIKSETI